MKYYLFILLIFSLFVTGCNGGSLPDKNLSKSNIEFIELTFPRDTNKKQIIKSDSSLDVFSKILNDREKRFAMPNNCYVLHIQLKDGERLNYFTDGINFEGFDDSSDLPFFFSTQVNVLKTVFNLEQIDSCK